MVEEMTNYHVIVTRGDRFWILDVPEVDRATQARHLREVDAMARDLIAIMTGADPDSIELDVRIEMPADAKAHLELAQKLREEAKYAQSSAAEEVRTAARLLRDEGLPLRDIGQLLDVSYQRAGQLVH
jgi:hypothetical protein